MASQYSPAEIRERLGVTRSALRYYMRKGLIAAEKDEQNGYHYFDQSDFLELIDVAYYRNTLEFSAEDSRDFLQADSVEQCLAVNARQIQRLEQRIEHDRACLELLRGYDALVAQTARRLNTIEIVPHEEDTYAYYPPAGPPDVRSELFAATYWCCGFYQDQEELREDGEFFMIAAKNLPLLREAMPDAPTRRLPAGRYLHAACCSHQGRYDPALLTPLASYAREHGLQTAGFWGLCYLFTLRQDNTRQHYYDAFVRLQP